MIIAPGVSAVNPNDLAVNPHGGKRPSGPVLPPAPDTGEALDGSAVCAECGGAGRPGSELIERFVRRLPGRAAASPRPVKALCAACAAAKGLDWCVSCHEWMPREEVGVETEVCVPCEMASGSTRGGRAVTPPPETVTPPPEVERLITDMEEVERCYTVTDGGDGWLRFQGNVSSDWATVWFPREGEAADDDRGLVSGAPVCLGAFARFPGDVYQAAAQAHLARRDMSAMGGHGLPEEETA